MQLTIHRGINQIGGCITEIATQKTRILIDLGQNLPDGNGVIEDELNNQDAIEKLTNGINAIFYTHYHGDHLGLFHLVPENINQYIGNIAKRVALCKHQQLAYIKGREEQSAIELSKLDKIKTFVPEQGIQIGDIKVTPYFVSHSAYDAYMFLIEADGKRVLHTGDFRGHGYLSKGLLPTIKKLILPKGNVDFLITEGTMLSRKNEKVPSENDLKKKVVELMKQYKNVFVMCSSTDMERLATFFAANKSMINRPFVCDDFQSKVFDVFTDSAGKKSQLFNFNKTYTFRKNNNKLLTWMKDKGFCMLVRPTDKFEDYISFLKPLLKHKDTVLIYSMWKEYVNPQSKHVKNQYLRFINNFLNKEKIHTSGHATASCLEKVCNLTNPKSAIIPIHSESSNEIQRLNLLDDLKNKIITSSSRIDNVIIKIPQT